ncbi:zf-HC2 domain-containing protein [Isoptericola sp. 4D.3]|uniref:Zf-HC2 domain-containing protein n=1 Tax=Isoptericola peretonis TaxID=2918523 RepID=A0ABT0IYA9_9MICO|nr:zf-HC2 domain-containing protein [Isoptericola sp. 4D.3]
MSDLADGQLDAASTERALAHVAGCARCAAELDAARAARRALAAACDVAPDPELTERLLALSASIPSTTGDPLRDRGSSPGWERPAAWAPTLSGDLGARRRSRTRRLVAVGAGGVGVLGVALFVLGQAPVVTPDPSRVAALTLLAGAEPGTTDPSSARETTAESLAWLAEHGWAAPRELPDGYAITALRTEGCRGADGSDGGPGTSVELDLAGPDGPAVACLRQGRLAELSASAAGGDDPAEAGTSGLAVRGYDVRVLSSDPWHVAWQSGDTAFDVAADIPAEALAELVAAFPGSGEGDDEGVLQELSRGWTTMTGAMTGALWRR